MSGAPNGGVKQPKGRNIRIDQIGPGAWGCTGIDANVRDGDWPRRKMKCGHYRAVKPGWPPLQNGCGICRDVLRYDGPNGGVS